MCACQNEDNIIGRAATCASWGKRRKRAASVLPKKKLGQNGAFRQCFQKQRPVGMKHRVTNRVRKLVDGAPLVLVHNLDVCVLQELQELGQPNPSTPKQHVEHERCRFPVNSPLRRVIVYRARKIVREPRQTQIHASCQHQNGLLRHLQLVLF